MQSAHRPECLLIISFTVITGQLFIIWSYGCSTCTSLLTAYLLLGWGKPVRQQRDSADDCDTRLSGEGAELSLKLPAMGETADCFSPWTGNLLSKTDTFIQVFIKVTLFLLLASGKPRDLDQGC